MEAMDGNKGLKRAVIKVVDIVIIDCYPVDLHSPSLSIALCPSNGHLQRLVFYRF
jgi:hypothetical protein